MKIGLKFTIVSILLGSLIFPAMIYPGQEYYTREIPPQNALSTFELADGFQIELIASEPLVADPVAMEIDENGRMYVVEMHGYPLDQSGSGKIKLLSDTNGDGQMDQSKVFADGLMLPTGILRWKKGILVTDAPNVLYLEDSDGDGRADIRDTLLTGFALSNPQHNLNNPIMGLDNWIYLGHESAISTQTFKKEFGDRGGEVYFPGQKDSPRLPENARGRGVRLKPDQLGLEVLSSNTQFGHTFDPWGHYFVVSNANHAIHQVMEVSYLNRNPALLIGNATQSISDHGRAAEVFPITRNPQNQLLTDVGVFTSACGTTYYQGGLFPAPFDQVTFVAEPVSNLVHADIIRGKGSTFEASRVYPKKEFLASTDAWFRPVNMYIGPEGALYIVDYYRQIIEHPEWMADDVINSGALYNGTDKGRIYRITPKNTKPATWTSGLTLGKMTDHELVEKLTDSNSWGRRTAQRLLLDRQAVSQVPNLVKMARENPNPLGRLHALWTLEGLDKLDTHLINFALQDRVEGIRENAIRLSQQYLPSSPNLINTLYTLQDDPHEKVRYQLLCTLGSVSGPEAAKVREKLLFRDIQDPWVQIAALSALPSEQSSLLTSVLSKNNPNEPAFKSLVERLSTMIGNNGSPEEINTLLSMALQGSAPKSTEYSASLVQGLAQGLKNNKRDIKSFSTTDKELLVKKALSSPDIEMRESCIQLLRVVGLPASKSIQNGLDEAVKLAINQKENPELRVAAIHFLALDEPQKWWEQLEKIIAPAEPLTVQQAALQALSDIPGVRVSQFITSQWPALTPEIRTAAIATFLGNEQRTSLLLDALEQGIIDPASISWPRKVSLMNHRNFTLRDRARALLTQPNNSRREVINAYATALTLEGNWEKGKVVYSRNCSVCHQIGGENGTAYGPDLGTIRNRRPESILADILNPNYSIADGYDLWSIEKVSGVTFEGLITNETPTSLTLRSYGGEETLIARSSIKSLKALSVSVMPAGLEKQISAREMADLLAFLKNRK